MQISAFWKNFAKIDYYFIPNFCHQVTNIKSSSVRLIKSNPNTFTKMIQIKTTCGIKKNLHPDIAYYYTLKQENHISLFLIRSTTKENMQQA